MNKFQVWMKAAGRHVLHCCLLAVGVTAVATMLIAKGLRWMLRPVPGAVFSVLPERYRGVFLLLTGSPKASSGVQQEFAD